MAKALIAVAIILFIIAFIAGIVIGNQASQFGSPQTLVWPTVLSYWFYGFVAALFFIALAEVIELLEKLNRKFEGRGRTALAEEEIINRTSEASTSGENSENSDEIKTGEKEKVPTYKDYPEAWAWTIGISILVILLIIAASNM